MDKLISTDLLRRVSLRQLQVFETIARHGSFTRAAEELFLTQPTVSMQIKKLADAVGAPLFEQIGKSMHLTDTGKALYSACREVFDVFERFDAEVADLKGMKKGRIRLAVVSTAKYFAPVVLGKFCELYPGIDVSLKVTNRERLLERLADNLDDFYIMGEPPSLPNAQFQHFMPNPLVMLAWREHPLANKPRIPLERLVSEPFIMREPGSGTRLAVTQMFQRRKLVPNIHMELGSNEAVKQAVASKLGISVLSSYSLSEGDSRVVVLDVKGFPITWNWYVGHPSGKKLSVLAKTFLEFLLVEGREIVRAQP